jgi:hypothetical protein
LAATYFGKKFDAPHPGSHTYVIIFIILALTFSWTVIITRYLKSVKEIRSQEKDKTDKK